MKNHLVYLLWTRKSIHWRTHMGLNHSFFKFVKNMLRDSLKVSYTKHLLSSSISLKNKEVITNHHRAKQLKGSGSSLFETLWQLLLSPLNMSHIHILSYSWVISLFLSHANIMRPYTHLNHSNYALVIVRLCLVISSWFNVANSLVMPYNFQDKLQPSSIILQYYWSFILVLVLTHLIYHVMSSSFFLCVDDGGLIKAFLRWFCSYRLQRIIQEVDLETN